MEKLLHTEWHSQGIANQIINKATFLSEKKKKIINKAIHISILPDTILIFAVYSYSLQCQYQKYLGSPNMIS